MGPLGLASWACGDSANTELRPDRGFRLPIAPETKDAGTTNHPCGVKVESGSGVTLEVYDSFQTWAGRLEGCVRTVGFDDVDVASTPLRIESDHYASLGLILTAANAGGQYVHPDFGLPADFPAVSVPNVYAPGPPDTPNSPGGHETTATFVVDGRPAKVAGFGAYFLDTDYPDIKLSGLTAFDGQRRPLGPFADVQGPALSCSWGWWRCKAASRWPRFMRWRSAPATDGPSRPPFSRS